MKKSVACPYVITSDKESRFRLNFPTDVLFQDSYWPLANECAERVLRHPNMHTKSIGLGNSISWILQIADVKSGGRIQPTYVSFSGKSKSIQQLSFFGLLNVDALDRPIQWTKWGNYLKDIKCHPTQLTQSPNDIRIFEYSETGKGLLSFLVALWQVAIEVRISPEVMFNKMTCVLFRPSWSIEQYGHEFLGFPCKQETHVMSKNQDELLAGICNDDSVRIVQSFNWFKCKEGEVEPPFNSFSSLQKLEILKDKVD